MKVFGSLVHECRCRPEPVLYRSLSAQRLSERTVVGSYCNRLVMTQILKHAKMCCSMKYSTEGRGEENIIKGIIAFVFFEGLGLARVKLSYVCI
jgi:hypothetical protein